MRRADNTMVERQKNKTLHTNLTKTRRVNTGAPEGLIVPAPLATAVVLLLNDTNIIRHGNRVEQSRRVSLQCRG